MKKVSEFWESGSPEKIFRTWKSKEWCQTLVPTKDMDHLYMELCSRKIPWHDGPYKICWGYSKLGRFNIKDSISLLIETHRLEKEAKWRKMWGGRWWSKVATFNWLILKCHILTWDNIQVRGILGPSRCILCENNNETINHLLDECPIAEAIWERGVGLFKKNHKLERKTQHNDS